MARRIIRPKPYVIQEMHEDRPECYQCGTAHNVSFVALNMFCCSEKCILSALKDAAIEARMDAEANALIFGNQNE